MDIETKTAEMNFMRLSAGYSSLDHRINYILEELKVDPVENK
jgi:hypothetical protein